MKRHSLTKALPFSLMSLAALMGGCAVVTPSIRSTDTFDPKSAYLYGRLTLTTTGRAGGMALYFEVRCRNGKRYRMGFREDGAPVVIKVVPSLCQVENVVLEGNSVRLTSPATFRLVRNEFLDPGGVYYVGDFAATTNVSMVREKVLTDRWSWKMTERRNNYEQTSAEVRFSFPSFQPPATENRMPR